MDYKEYHKKYSHKVKTPSEVTYHMADENSRLPCGHYSDECNSACPGYESCIEDPC